MDKIILLCLFSLFGLVTKGNAELHCFVCSNCADVNQLDRNMIENCDFGDPDTTTVTDITTTDPDMPTTVTDITTTDPDITTTDHDITTTDPDITTTDPDITTTDPDITTTDPDITTTDPDMPTTVTDTTVTDPDTTTTTTDVNTTPTTPIEIPTTTPQIPTDDTTTSFTDDGPATQTTPAVPPTTTTQAPVSPPVMGHNYRLFMRQQVDDYQCYTIHRRVGEAVQVNRGCAVTRETTEETCVEANLGESYEYCDLCAHDECNIASKYVISLTVVLSLLFIALLIN